jgi:transposase
MPAKFVIVDRNTPMLLPPDLRDWVNEDDLVHFVIEAVERLPLGAFKTNHRGSGHAQLPPHMMLALLIYCYSNGIFSSRKIERATYRDISVRYLTADTHPDHDTICKFRRENLSAISTAFVEILQLAREMGLLKLGKVSTDGTHIKASASMTQNVNYQRANELKVTLQQDIEALLKEAEGADRDDQDEQQLPAQIAHRQKLLSKMDEAIEGLKKRAEAQQEADQRAYEKKKAGREAKAKKTGKKVSGRGPKKPKEVEEIAQESKATHNLTDPDSRVMRKSKHAAYTQSINAQASVDADGSYLIVGQHLSQSSSDANELLPAYQSISKGLGTPTALIADAGYVNIEAIEELLDTNCEPYVSVSSEHAHNERHYDFRPNQPRPVKPISHPTLLQMREKLAHETGKAIYRLRSQTIETVFGIIKEVMGFRAFLLRGLEKMQGEWELVCLAYNCKRLHKIIQSG